MTTPRQAPQLTLLARPASAVGEAGYERPVLSATIFGPGVFETHADLPSAALAGLAGRSETVWLNVQGVGDPAVLQAVAEAFALHPLAMEDVAHQNQRAKVEGYKSHLFAIFRVVDLKARSEQLALFLGENFVLTMQNRPMTFIAQVRESLARPDSKVRQHRADFLAYSIVDALIDRYFPQVEEVSDRIDLLQEQVVAEARPSQVREIAHVKRDLLRLRRAVAPLREELRTLMHHEAWVHQDTAPYLRDCHDHVLVLGDGIDTLREVAAGLMDTYLSMVNHRMNEIMKTLTTIATIFIPLTFIAGVYGMNFDPEASPWNMPELRWFWGYPWVLSLMAVVGLTFTGYMWRKGWLRSSG